MARPICHDKMTFEEARAVILFHGTGDPPPEADWETELEEWETGFLGSMRPFRGILNEQNFEEVMLAIEILAQGSNKEKIDRELMSSLWAITYLGWLWGLAPGGMLQRNNLISAEDTERLERWIEAIGMKIYIDLLYSK